MRLESLTDYMPGQQVRSTLMDGAGRFNLATDLMAEMRVL